MTGITRRDAIKGAARVALATGALAATSGAVLGGTEAPPIVPKPILPPDAKGVYFSLVAKDERELTFLLKGGIFRDATDEELRAYYERNPFWVEHGKPTELRELFADSDGEVFALFAERHQLGAAQDKEGLATNRQAICETPAVTDAGVSMKLGLLLDATWGHGSEKLSPVQQRQLLWNALAWLYHTQMNDEPLVVRPLDREKLADGLKGYREKGGES